MFQRLYAVHAWHRLLRLDCCNSTQVAEEEHEEAEAVEAVEVALRAEVVAEGVTGGDSEGGVEVVADFVVAVAASGGEAEAEAGFRCHSLAVMIVNAWPDHNVIIKPLVILCLTYTAPPSKLYACRLHAV